MAGRASIVGAAATHVGNVREHNEDAHFFDEELGLFVVCDGMGGHAAGEVASAIAIRTLREKWSEDDTQEVAEVWLARGTAIAKKQLLDWLRDGVVAAHQAILAEAERDPTKGGMGTTLVAAMVVGSELVFAHAGDSRAYMVRDGIATQLTEDHTLLQRLLAAGIDVDVSGDGSRFRSMLTNALGIGQECKVSTFVVPLADGDRFMICSDGISEYVEEAEVGEVLVKQPSPARAAQKLVDLALERGGADNATAVVIRVLEAGDNPLPAEQRRRDDLSISLCDLWSEKVSPQQRLRAMRIAIAREHVAGDKLPAHTFGDRVAWIIVEGEVNQHGEPLGPGSLIYPESLLDGTQPPDKDGLAVARTEIRAVAIRNDDFKELCEEDAELGEALLESLATIMAAAVPSASTVDSPAARASTDPQPGAPAGGPGRAQGSTPPATVARRAETDNALDRAIEYATTVPPPIAGASDATTGEPEIEVVRAVPESARMELELQSLSSPDLVITPVTDEPSAPITLPVKRRWPTAPEIEMTMEADEPDERDAPSSRDDTEADDDLAEMSVSTDDGTAKVIRTVTEESDQTVTVTVEEPTRSRAVTPDDAVSISGTIEPRSGGGRAKRMSEGWEE